MKKYIVFLFIIALILVMIFAPDVQAGKPRSTAYPPPDTTFESQAYPAPGLPFPVNPDEFCVDPNEPCVWGLYYTDAWRWYVSKYTPAPALNEVITLCVANENPYTQYCYHHSADGSGALKYVEYTDGMSIYATIPFVYCGWFGAMPDTSSWGGQRFVMHEPNWYHHPCVVWDNPIYLPFVRKP